jgi:hypothetical protein
MLSIGNEILGGGSRYWGRRQCRSIFGVFIEATENNSDNNISIMKT